MKYQALAVAASFITTAAAFPRMNAEQLETYQRHAEQDPSAGCPFAAQAQQAKADAASGYPFSGSKEKTKRAATFNAKEQRISVDGEHEFIPPDFDAGDERGKPKAPSYISDFH